MSERPALPDINVLSSISPKEEGGVLYSPNLESYIEKYSPFESAMWGAFLYTTPGDIEELSKAKKLADYYHLKTAQRLQNNPQNELVWVDRFNQAGSEIYGSINPEEVAQVITQQLQAIESGQPDSYAAQVYRQLLGNTATEAVESRDFEQLIPMREAMFSHFSPIVEVINALPEGPYDSAMIRDIFETIIQILAQDDAEWSVWTITNTEGKTMLSVLPAEKEIDVPDGRGLVSTRAQLLGLAMHEIGVHAQRAVNGYHTDDELMAKGLPNYIDFEEGLGILFEYLTTGVVADKVVDRYVDIALATGAVDGFILSRETLIKLGTSREAARASARQQQLDEANVRKDIVNHVNRIFRGGNGQPIIDQTGSIVTQPVFNKDLVYHKGFIKAHDFVAQQLAAGTSASELLEYLLSGKFDATESSHVAYLESRHSLSI